MKRLLSIFLAAVMLLGVMPWQVFAEEPQPNVTLVGQWTGESSRKEDTKKHYAMDDKIGVPIPNGGLLRGLAKQFLGWSNVEPTEENPFPPKENIFSSEDTIADVFPDGIPKDAKIYAVYYELNGFGKAFNTADTLTMGDVAKQLENNINNNKVTINNNVEPDKVLKDTEIYKADKDNNSVIDYYKKDNTNEVVLKSEFEMDWLVAMLAYRNMIGSSQLRPILSRNDFKRYEKNIFIDKKDSGKLEAIEGFSIKDGEETGYTYVDLNMDFGKDDGLVVPEKLFLAFKSYTWRPLCAFGIKENGDKEVLNILGVDGSTKGNKPDAFKGLVSNKNPETKFGVETNNYRKITVRVVLRKWGGKDVNYQDDKILESDIPEGPQGTIASEILSNMTLRVLGSADGIKNESIVRITDAKAKALADGEASENIEITGSIKGHVFASAGSVTKKVPFLGNITVHLKSDAEINKSEVKKPMKLSYIHKKEEPNPEPKPNPNPQGPFYKGSTLILPTEEKKEEPTEEHIAYIFGYPDKSVKPEGTLTRAEAAAMVTRLGNLDLSDTTKADYPDLKDGAWYLPHINAALKAGMLDTDEAGMLRPDAPVTRGEFVKMIAAIDKASDGKAPFTDIAGHKYEKEINQVYGNGRALGYEDSSFKPDASLTRAEAAAFLNRVFNRVADDAAVMGLEDRLEKFTDLQKGTWYYYELVEATNSHELIRRGGQDELNRAYEKWIAILQKRAAR